MIAAQDLIELVRTYNPKTDATMIEAAFDFGREMHEGQFRQSGEPYFCHPAAVAAILALLGRAVAFEKVLAASTHFAALAERHMRLANRVGVVVVVRCLGEEENVFVIRGWPRLHGGGHRVRFLPHGSNRRAPDKRCRVPQAH